jgi:hypothetical protein
MKRYSGMSFHAQKLQDKIHGWVNKNGVPPVGSKAWEAKLEIRKLPHVIDNRMAKLAKGDLTPQQRQKLEKEVAHLEHQLDGYKKDFKAMDKDPGKGFVAAQSMTREQLKAESGVARAKHDSLLRGALGRQGLKKGDPYPHGLKEKWTVKQHGHTYEVRVHPADPKYGKDGDIYRVARRKDGVDANGQGYGWEYSDSNGNWHHTSKLKPGKGTSVNPSFDSQAAEDTHISMPSGVI